MADSDEQALGLRAGLLAGAGAFFLWGIFPLYWRELRAVDSLELIAHRVVWSLGFLWWVVWWRGRMAQYREAVRTPRLIGLYLLSGLLLAANWLTYIWAVMHAQVVEASLGYFLVPLCNVVLGATVLGERLRPAQWIAVACAAIGVGVQLVQAGRLPWIAVVLALTFAAYGLLRKRGPLGPLTGLAMETTLLAPLAVGFLLFETLRGTGALGVVGGGEHTLIFLSGVVTAVPLLLFATAARGLPLTTLGLLQYLSPSVQLALGVWLFGEPFDRARAMSFALIWLGLVLYTIDGLRHARRATKPVAIVPVPDSSG